MILGLNSFVSRNRTRSNTCSLYLTSLICLCGFSLNSALKSASSIQTVLTRMQKDGLHNLWKCFIRLLCLFFHVLLLNWLSSSPNGIKIIHIIWLTKQGPKGKCLHTCVSVHFLKALRVITVFYFCKLLLIFLWHVHDSILVAIGTCLKNKNYWTFYKLQHTV